MHYAVVTEEHLVLALVRLVEFFSAALPLQNSLEAWMPCPCGSGKKFKQCHGNPGRMQ